MTQPKGTFVDPRVSRAKFARELADYRAREEEYQRRGWWMLMAEFPTVFAVFGAPKANLPLVVFGVVLDFTNYDLWPPSVTLVHPFTRVPYKGKELPHQFLRKTVKTVPGPETGQMLQVEELLHLMQHWDTGDEPFLCLPGVREYHDNPGHSGDSWLMHRRRGEGTLHFIFEQLYRYGAEPIRAINFQVRATPAGFIIDGVPV